jgi:hypothetical protein
MFHDRIGRRNAEIEQQGTDYRSPHEITSAKIHKIQKH